MLHKRLFAFTAAALSVCSFACSPAPVTRVPVVVEDDRGGYVGDTIDSHRGRVEAQEKIISEQEKQLREQNKEQEDLERQKYYNELLKDYE